MKKLIAFLLFLFSAQASALIVPVNFTVKGEYTIAVISDGGRREYRGENLFTDYGMDWLGGSSGTLRLGLSSSNTAPSFSTTLLPSPLGLSPDDGVKTLVVVSSAVPGPYTVRQDTVYTFALGAIVGNVCKLGLVGGTNIAANTLVTEALVSVSGVPTCVTVLAGEQVIVTYRMTVTYPADAPATVNFDDDGVVTSLGYLARPSSLGQSGSTRPQFFSNIAPASIFNIDGYFSAESTNPYNSGQVNAACSSAWDLKASTPAYIAGSHYKDFVYSGGPGVARTLRKFCMAVTGTASFIYFFDSPVTLSADKRMTITFRVSWSR